MIANPHPSAAQLLSAPSPGLPAALRFFPRGGEWLDTDATFHPAVLVLYPEVPPPPPGTVSLGVGYGSLVALDGAGKQISFLSGDGWSGV